MRTPEAIGEAFQVNGIWHQDYNVDGAVVRYMHNGKDWVKAQATKSSLPSTIKNTAAGISLQKNVVNLDKCIINLSKSKGVNLDVHRAKVAAIVDFSGSMRGLYNNGSVQRTLNRLVPLGLKFDDNGELDVWLFNSDYKRIDGMDVNNFENFVAEEIMKSGFKFGCTSYSPVIKDAMRKYIDEEPSRYPAFLIFITDGSNDDKKSTDEIIRLSSRYNVFIQFVGLGRDDDFKYLKKLDDLSGRAMDNTGFIQVEDFDKMTDEELYEKLLEQYVDWVKVMGIS